MIYGQYPIDWTDPDEYPGPPLPPGGPAPATPPGAIVDPASTETAWGTGGLPQAPGTPDYSWHYEMPDFTGSPLLINLGPYPDLPPVPELDLPEFSMPSYEDALEEPGFAFRLASGREALEKSAAARGVLRTGGTLKDLIEYGQNFGASEYANVFNRALSAYAAENERLKSEFAPRMTEWQTKTGALGTEWQTKANALIQAKLAEYQRQYQLYATYVDWLMNRERIMASLDGSENEPEPPQWLPE